MQGRGAITDQLADLIQLAQLGQKTGVLIVERGEDTALEQGMITFSRGQVVQASSGRYSGWEALNYLKTWRKCRFTFSSGTPLRAAAPLPSDGLPTQQGLFSTASRSAPEGRGADERGLVPLTPSRPPIHTQPAETLIPRLQELGFSRAYRHLFMLIDGKRSDMELAHLISKSPEEVRAMLDELERARLIQR